MTADETLERAVAEFEATFTNVQMGEAGQFFTHVDGARHDYIEVFSGWLGKDGRRIVSHDTAEEAVKAWRDTANRYEGREFLYWRIRPEIRQDENKTDFVSGGPNQHFGKWVVYSRFRALP